MIYWELHFKGNMRLRTDDLTEFLTELGRWSIKARPFIDVYLQDLGVNRFLTESELQGIYDIVDKNREYRQGNLYNE